MSLISDQPSRLSLTHRLSALLALGLLFTFWTSTIVVEALGDPGAITRVKTLIAFAIPLMALLMATAALSGQALGKNRTSPILRAKQLRTRLAALNAIVVLIPAAITLALWAQHGRFGPAFVGVQAVELCAGAVNFVLLGLNVKAGLRLSRRKHPA